MAFDETTQSNQMMAQMQAQMAQMQQMMADNNSMMGMGGMMGMMMGQNGGGADASNPMMAQMQVQMAKMQAQMVQMQAQMVQMQAQMVQMQQMMADNNSMMGMKGMDAQVNGNEGAWPVVGGHVAAATGGTSQKKAASVAADPLDSAAALRDVPKVISTFLPCPQSKPVAAVPLVPDFAAALGDDKFV
ncbi:hypothetical protein T492DRAFT_1130378 [Pavlovales sp. CCMP2436]|nr:hypothetical protein T492DRAFT_1130378 [Pavlovales sp. CCMP2436]